MHRRVTTTTLALWMAVSSSSCCCNWWSGSKGGHYAHALGDDDYREFVEEIIEEDAWHHDQDNPFFEDPEPPTPQEDLEQERIRQRQEEERQKLQAEAERRQQQKAEEAFTRELSALPEDQQKLLRQKRRKDGKIVQGILKAWQRQDLYAVLGLRWFFPEGIRIIKGRGGKQGVPQTFDIQDAILKRQWPHVVILRIPTRAIQQAYRSRAMQTHPDKNRDPRTEQAFVAVQDASAVLSDPKLRKEYELECQGKRRERRQVWKDRYHKLVNTTLRPVWIVARRVVGPMAVPLVVLCALLF